MIALLLLWFGAHTAQASTRGRSAEAKVENNPEIDPVFWCERLPATRTSDRPRLV
jgi:hypothetical protein